VTLLTECPRNVLLLRFVVRQKGPCKLLLFNPVGVSEPHDVLADSFRGSPINARLMLKPTTCTVPA